MSNWSGEALYHHDHDHRLHHDHGIDHNMSNEDGIIDRSFDVIDKSDFLVDGCVLAVNFSISSDKKDLDVIVGSNCGFVCLFSKRLGNDKDPFRGPFMIVQGLWDATKKQDDHVLCVCKIPYVGVAGFDRKPNSGEEVIALGTLSGRIFLFTRKTKMDCGKEGGRQISEFSCLWHVPLPYPIHSISYTYDTYNLPSLVIMTQRTVHLFNVNIASCVDNARNGLNELIRHYKS